jgi:hypothetical protein
MKLDIRAVALAVGSVSAAVYAICAFFVAVAPGPTTAAFSCLFHVDLTGIARPITWGSFLAGLLATGLGMALLAGVTVWVYNRLVRG